MSLLIGRLAKKKDFDRVFSQGRSSYGNFLGFKTLPNEDEVSRLGIIVSKKVSKLAVERNRIRRRIRSIMNELAADFTGYWDLVVIVLPGAKDKPFFEIKDLILANLYRQKVIKTNLSKVRK